MDERNQTNTHISPGEGTELVAEQLYRGIAKPGQAHQNTLRRTDPPGLCRAYSENRTARLSTGSPHPALPQAWFIAPAAAPLL